MQLMRTLARDSQKTQAGTSTALEEEAAASIAEGAASTTPGTAALATDSATKKAPSEASQGAEAFVNLLAYNTDWMQKLWKRASMLCHLPHEVHAESTVGNDIPTLKGGIVDLEESPREALHLFCELLTHALVVTGDDAFHDGDEPLPLPCLRAVTVSLNSLVFHSCMKPDEVAAVSTLPAAAKLDESQQQLFTLAGRCLQQLHSRHVRRPFTPESAWLAPWNAWSGNNTVRPPLPKYVHTLSFVFPLCKPLEDHRQAGVLMHTVCMYVQCVRVHGTNRSRYVCASVCEGSVNPDGLVMPRGSGVRHRTGM